MDSALPPSPFTISHEEFCLFHRIDRQLYWVLVINLHRDLDESMQVLAMWLWLERMGYNHLVKKITSLPYTLINNVADETVLCLKYINTTHFSYFSYSMPFTSKGCDIFLIQSLVDKEISAQLLYDNRDSTLQGVSQIRRNVCAKAFSDIMQQAIVRNTADKIAKEQRKMAEQSAVLQQQQQPPFWFGSIAPSHVQSSSNVAQGGADHQIRGKSLAQEKNSKLVPTEERTLFMTFSKRYPIAEKELREFFIMVYGDSVEALYMQEVQPNKQPLFARIVFHNTSIIDMITRGSGKARLSINGKYVWARKFSPKRTKIMLSIPTYNNYTGESSRIAGMMKRN